MHNLDYNNSVMSLNFIPLQHIWACLVRDQNLSY